MRNKPAKQKNGIQMRLNSNSTRMKSSSKTLTRLEIRVAEVKEASKWKVLTAAPPRLADAGDGEDRQILQNVKYYPLNCQELPAHVQIVANSTTRWWKYVSQGMILSAEHEALYQPSQLIQLYQTEVWLKSRKYSIKKESLMKIISVFNNKGGVGKSTFIPSSGKSIRTLSKKVLLI